MQGRDLAASLAHTCEAMEPLAGLLLLPCWGRCWRSISVAMGMFGWCGDAFTPNAYNP